MCWSFTKNQFDVNDYLLTPIIIGLLIWFRLLDLICNSISVFVFDYSHYWNSTLGYEFYYFDFKECWQIIWVTFYKGIFNPYLTVVIISKNFIWYYGQICDTWNLLNKEKIVFISKEINHQIDQLKGIWLTLNVTFWRMVKFLRTLIILRRFETHHPEEFPRHRLDPEW